MGCAAGSGEEICCGGEEEEAPKGQKEYKSKVCSLALNRCSFSLSDLFFFKSVRPWRRRFELDAAEVREALLPRSGR